jgi:hypothetical protein
MGEHLGYRKHDAAIEDSYWSGTKVTELRQASAKFLILLTRERVNQLREQREAARNQSGRASGSNS